MKRDESTQVSSDAGREEISIENSNKISIENSNESSVAGSDVRHYKKLTGKVLGEMGLSAKEIMIVMYCSVPRTVEQIIAKARVKDYSQNRRAYTTALVERGVLLMTIPENPKDKNQKYVRAREIVI